MKNTFKYTLIADNESSYNQLQNTGFFWIYNFILFGNILNNTFMSFDIYYIIKDENFI